MAIALDAIIFAYFVTAAINAVGAAWAVETQDEYAHLDPLSKVLSVTYTALIWPVSMANSIASLWRK